MYDLVDSLTFKTRAISPRMWPVFELTYKLFKSDAVDFLEGDSLLYRKYFLLTLCEILEMLPALDNFLSYGSDVIISNPEYKRMLLDIYTTSITNDQLGDNDRINGCNLAESMLLNLRGHIDDVWASAFTPVCSLFFTKLLHRCLLQ